MFVVVPVGGLYAALHPSMLEEIILLGNVSEVSIKLETARTMSIPSQDHRRGIRRAEHPNLLAHQVK